MGFVIAKSTTLLLLVVFLSGGTPSFCSANKSSHSILCIKSEKQALLSFKEGIIDDAHNSLSSWVAEEEECCKWAGVACDNITGHVKELRLGLSGSVIDGRLKGELNPSLLSLTHLSYLDLSAFDVEGAQIPKFIGSLAGLRYLDLSDANFSGRIPKELGNLSSLNHLNLRSNLLHAENLEWLPGLSSLEFLDLSSLNLSKASNHWLLAVNKLPSLIELHLSFCELGHMHSLSFINFTSLEFLNISYNSFNSLLPHWIFSLSNLVYLDLHKSQFVGPFPNSSRSLNSLTWLDASENYLNSTIPSYLYGFANLEFLALSDNNLCGFISSAIGNLTSIISLSLSYNALDGELPMSIGNLRDLESLYLDHNLLSGPVPWSLRKLSALESFDISKNQFNGSFPESVASLSNLRSLDICQNHFKGVVSEVHFASLKSLTSLRASQNPLTLRVSPDWIPPFHLDDLAIGSWYLNGQFPTWLRSQKGLHILDLSNSGISGTIPTWFWNLSYPYSFDYLNFCNNQLYGELPDVLPVNHGSVLYLCSNKFNGTVPRNLFAVLWLNLSNNSLSGNVSEALCHPTPMSYTHGDNGSSTLTLLDLRGNFLSGKIPDCWMKWPSLEVVLLDNNNLTGEIPNSMRFLQNLRTLHLRNNSLSGEMHPFLKNCTMLRNLDLGLNKFVGSIPTWLGVSLSNLTVLGVRSNKLYGKIPRSLCRLTRLQILDVADNNLSGTIPSCFSNFNAMATKNHSSEVISYSLYINSFIVNALVVTKGRLQQYDKILPLVTSLDLSSNNLTGEIPKQLTSLQGLISLNLSKNHLRGNIPDKIGDLESILSLDFSRNELYGKIPESISKLNFLSYLNVSCNNLSGEIPSSTQLQSLDPSSFVGNQLCRPPLPMKCRSDHNTMPAGAEEEEGDRDEEKYWFRLGIAIGFAVGFLGIISPLAFYGFYRRVYFWFLEEYLWYKILDFCIKIKSMMRN